MGTGPTLSAAGGDRDALSALEDAVYQNSAVDVVLECSEETVAAEPCPVARSRQHGAIAACNAARLLRMTAGAHCECNG